MCSRVLHVRFPACLFPLWQRPMKRSLTQHSQVKTSQQRERVVCRSASPSHSDWGEFLVTRDTGATGGRWARGLKGSVSSLCGVQEGWASGHGVGIADVLRVQKLSLVGHDLCGLLAVEHGEVSGHVDKDAGVRGQAAGGLGPHEGSGGRTGCCRWGGGAGRGGRAGLARGRTPGGPCTGHHGDGFQQAATAGPASCCTS